MTSAGSCHTVYLSRALVWCPWTGLPEAAQLPPSVEQIPLDAMVVLISLAGLFPKAF